MDSISKIIHKVSDYNRERKYKLFCQLFKPDANTRILDVGASEKEIRATSNLLEKRYPYPENITVLGIHDFNQFRKKYPNVKIVKYKGNAFPFKDKMFDVCWSNATIEHVGNRQKQVLFLKEISRVSKHVFISTPNRYFVFEPHSKVVMLHFLPKKIFDKILILSGIGQYAGDYMHLLGRGDIVKLMKRCNIDEYKIIKNKIFGLTIDFVISF